MESLLFFLKHLGTLNCRRRGREADFLVDRRDRLVTSAATTRRELVATCSTASEFCIASLAAAVAHVPTHLKNQGPFNRLAQLLVVLSAAAALAGPAVAAPSTPAPSTTGYPISEKDRAHWSFQPLKRPTVPTVHDRRWVGNPIDAFILTKLEARGLAPNPPATNRELLRRACYDLTGLPPTPEEVESFTAQSSPMTYEQLIDRLLDSPHYGEKWGRHWLDLVRYAESNSYERDDAKPHVWRYRDYVIRSFNADKPYDRFVREQLAGDEIADRDPETIIATGFYRLGIWDDEPVDPEIARFDGLDDIMATTSQVMLGLTVDCARCHNHKLDPIPQRDYYRLLAFFHNVNHYRNGGPTDEIPLFRSDAERIDYERRVRELDAKRKDLQADLAETEKVFRKLYIAEQKLTEAEFDKLAGEHIDKLIKEATRLLGSARVERYEKIKREFEALKKQKVSVDVALAVTEAGSSAPETHVLARGNPTAKEEKVEPGFLQVLGGSEPSVHVATQGTKSSGRRTRLADWIASPQNPLAARVMANRIWQYHFGRGLVRSPNNFGLQGDAPTHRELLDWLASEFIRQGWRLKPIHRLIMTSNAYRMSSRGRAEALQADPVNDFFWRFDMRRLTAEEIRDSFLAITGTLNPKMFGPSIFVKIPKEVLAGQSQPGKGWGQSTPGEQSRRSLYIHVKRSLLVPTLESFDMAETDRSTPVRFVTTQPTQALGLLNGAFLNEQAALFAERLQHEEAPDLRRQIRRALYLATARDPSDSEIQRGLALVHSLQTQDGVSPKAALEYFCLMALNLNETIYLD